MGDAPESSKKSRSKKSLANNIKRTERRVPDKKKVGNHEGRVGEGGNGSLGNMPERHNDIRNPSCIPRVSPTLKTLPLDSNKPPPVLYRPYFDQGPLMFQ